MHQRLSAHRVRLRRRLFALIATGTALTLASGCVATGTDRPAGPSPTADHSIVQDNLDSVLSHLRSYAIDDSEFEPHLTAHLFGIPGVSSLSAATEARVLEAIETAGGFGDRLAYSPVLTDPAQRWPSESFASTSASGVGSATPSTTDSPEDDRARLQISSQVLAAGGNHLISTLVLNSTVHVLVTDLAADTTVGVEDLFDPEIDPVAVGVDESGALTLKGSPVAETDLTPLGVTVARSLQSRVDLPDGADDRNPDFSCALLPCVALTYDDGPGEPEVEDSLLDAAAEANIRLTYFLLGTNAADFPETVERVAGQGHEIANHTHTHPKLDRSTPATVRSQVQQADEAIEAAGAQRPGLLRPPYGALNGAAAKAAKRPAILWDVDTEDWRHKDPQKIVGSVVTDAEPGSIVLMHSIHPSTVEAAPAVFAAVAEKGLYAVTVSELFAGIELTAGAQYFCRGYGNRLCSNPEHPAVRRS